MRALAVTAVFPWVMAWQYRTNELLCFVIIATLFAKAAMLSLRGENVSDRPLRIFFDLLADLHAYRGSFLPTLRPKKEAR